LAGIPPHRIGNGGLVCEDFLRNFISNAAAIVVVVIIIIIIITCDRKSDLPVCKRVDSRQVPRFVHRFYMHLPCFSANGGTKGRRRLGIGIIMQQVLKCSCQPAGSDLSPTHPTNDSHDLVQSAASSSHNIITNTNTTTSGPMSIPRASSLLHEAADCSVAGILYKWVNMARGWRPRWFILKNGILSYYKVHGPDKITLSDAKHKTSQIIGGESEKLLKSQRSIPRPSKAFGELHLQVGSHFSYEYECTCMYAC
jgi:hypothetical protein